MAALVVVAVAGLAAGVTAREKVYSRDGLHGNVTGLQVCLHLSRVQHDIALHDFDIALLFHF